MKLELHSKPRLAINLYVGVISIWVLSIVLYLIFGKFSWPFPIGYSIGILLRILFSNDTFLMEINVEQNQLAIKYSNWALKIKEIKFLPSPGLKVTFIGSKSFSLNPKLIVDNENEHLKFRTFSKRSMKKVHEFWNLSGVSLTPAEDKILVYPNPFREHFEISLNSRDEGILQIRLIDNNGKKILINSEEKISTGEFHKIIEAKKEWASGIYWLQLSLNGKSEFLKIVKG